MKFSNIKHIFFDLDHTLWDFDKNSGLAFRSIFLKHQLNIGLDDFMRIYAPINENYWKLYREDKVSKEDLRYGRLKETFDSLKLNVSDDLIEEMGLDYIDHLPRHNHLLGGSLEILDYLHPNYRMHIITNGFKEVQHKKLSSSGILQYFETITTSEDVGVKKPHPLIFETALKNASATVAESVMIGDNLEADIMGARKLGMRTILYNYHKSPCGPDDIQVLEMQELTSYL